MTRTPGTLDDSPVATDVHCVPAMVCGVQFVKVLKRTVVKALGKSVDTLTGDPGDPENNNIFIMTPACRFGLYFPLLYV